MRQDDSTVRKAEMAAIERVRRYVEMRDAKPLKGHGDEIHAIHKGTEWEALVTLADLRAILATLESSPADGDGGAEDWAWFTEQHRLELTHYSPVYGDDDDQSIEWRVHKQGGSINDREWDLVGRGETALEAVQNARKALTPTETGEQGK